MLYWHQLNHHCTQPVYFACGDDSGADMKYSGPVLAITGNW
jgi:hypothetical protein